MRQTQPSQALPFDPTAWLPNERFQCPWCRGPLHEGSGVALLCHVCVEVFHIEDGIVDFVRSDPPSITDPDALDDSHRIAAERVEADYRTMRSAAGLRWPDSLGSVLEVGCDTGLLTRAMLRAGDSSDVVVTAPSIENLIRCRAILRQGGLLGTTPVTFATYDAENPCLADATFDTVIGASFLRRLPDVPAFLTDVLRILKPGGRAFFAEPNQRFLRAIMHTLADITALLLGRDDGSEDDRKAILHLLARYRRAMLHQDDPAFLRDLGDKNSFVAELFEDLGFHIGFTSAAALPRRQHSIGTGFLASLLTQVGIDDGLREDILELLPAYSTRYMSLLSRRDRSPGLLLWLEKGADTSLRSIPTSLPDSDAPARRQHDEDMTGGLPVRAALTIRAERTDAGLFAHVTGWCLANADIRWLCVTLDGTSRDAAVARPRPDVHQAINGKGLYHAWNSLCCGIESRLPFGAVGRGKATIPLAVEVVFCDGSVLRLCHPSHLRLNETVRISV